MKRISLMLITVTLLAAVSCKNGNKKTSNDRMNEDQDTTSTVMGDMDSANNEMDSQEKTITVNLEGKSGSDLSGTATFTQKDGKVTMNATIKGLKKGEHAIHIHEKGDCSADDGSSAGGHWNPTDEKHGKWGASDGYHRGDIGNFTTNDDGVGTIEFSTDEWCIGCDDDKKNIVGHSVVIHQGKDDFKSQPSGDAGKRVGCGEIKDNM